MGEAQIYDLLANPWNGGFGLSVAEVGALTLDQVFLLFADRKALRSGGKHRTVARSSLEVAVAAKGGKIRGRAADGTPLLGVVSGTSVASRLAAEQAAKGRETKAGGHYGN